MMEWAGLVSKDDKSIGSLPLKMRNLHIFLCFLVLTMIRVGGSSVIGDCERRDKAVHPNFFHSWDDDGFRFDLCPRSTTVHVTNVLV